MAILLLTLALAACADDSTSPTNRNTPPKGNNEKTTGLPIELRSIGQRLKVCTSELDDQFYGLTPEQLTTLLPDLKQGAKGLEMTVPGATCVRVGGDFRLEVSDSAAPLLATVIPTRIVYEPATNTSQITFDVLERFESLLLNTAGDRVPNCPERFFDWEKFYVDKEGHAEYLHKLKNGEISANLWNGAFNCFRVGTTAKVLVRDLQGPKGSITISEVRLLHISEVTAELANLVGKGLAELKEELEKQASTDGGYLSFIRFSYSEN